MSGESISLTMPPKGWVWTTLGAVCQDPQYGWTTGAVAKGALHLLRTTDITSGKIHWETVPFCRDEPPDKDKYLLHDGDIVISRAGSVGYSYLVSNPPLAVFASYLIRFRPLVDEQYLAYFLQSPSYWQAISESSLGIALANVNASKLKQIALPLAPLPEQRRIVAKIDELFTQLDAGVEALRRVKAQLKRYRQAVLKHAFEGKLTAEWREAHKGELEPASAFLARMKGGSGERKELCAPDTSELPDLPDGWLWATLEQLSERIVDCLHSTPKFTSEGQYCVDTNCVEPGRIVFERARFVSEEVYQERVRRLQPEAGDIVFSREGTIGTAVPVPENVRICLGQRMMMFRPVAGIVPSYFVWAMMCPAFENQWKARVTGTTVPHVNIRDLRTMALPLAPGPEQRRIAEEIQRYFSIADEVENTTDRVLQASARLRQSILKGAFEGRLVPQDPTDEPAERLLERIRQDRMKQESAKSTDRDRFGVIQRRLL